MQKKKGLLLVKRKLDKIKMVISKYKILILELKIYKSILCN